MIEWGKSLEEEVKKDKITQLEKLLIDDEDFRELETKLRYYCPFEAMGMTDNEIRHAHFLAYILDPNRPHGFDDTYLRAFLNVAAEKGLGVQRALRPIDVHLLNLGNACIKRETGRVDLRIEIPSALTTTEKPVVLIFELKINAGESADQLQRYVERMQSEYRGREVLFFYLTLMGDDPSENNREKWLPLSMRDVVSRLDVVSQQDIGREDARQIVRAYVAMMGRKHLGTHNDELEKLAARIWENHPEALELLVSYQPADEISERLSDLFGKQSELCEILELTDLGFKPDPSSKPKEIVLYPEVFDHLHGDGETKLFVLTISRYNRSKDEIRIQWLIRKGNKVVREKIYNGILGQKKKLTGDWTQIASINYKPDGENEPIGSALSSENGIGRAIRDFVEKEAPRFKELRPGTGGE